MELSYNVDGSATMKGGPEATLTLSNKPKLKQNTFIATLKKETSITITSHSGFKFEVVANYFGTEKKVPLTEKIPIMTSIFLAGGVVPIFINIWCQPVLYYSFNAFVKVEAEVQFSWKGEVGFHDQPQIEYNGKEVTTKGFESDNVKLTS